MSTYFFLLLASSRRLAEHRRFRWAGVSSDTVTGVARVTRLLGLQYG